MKIAVEGCCHGELEKIYATIQHLEEKEGIKVDLLLCCGDFQAVRNERDMECMAVPKKFRTMNSFYKYYSGEKKAPILTLFIGGNHEASNYLGELAYGGWVAPNIYYLGYASVVNYGGIRIGGISGIFKQRDFRKGHFEIPPYSQDTVRSAYHTRGLEVFRLKQIAQPIDIMMSHDWPRGIYHHGNTQRLLREKTFFRDDVQSNTLGSPCNEELLHHLKPAYWFAAHLHVKFAAAVSHGSEGGEERTTKFLALDKCLPRRKFLQVVDIPHKTDAPWELTYDTEWLAILQSTKLLLTTNDRIVHMPNKQYNNRWDYSASLEELSAVREIFQDDLKIPLNFTKTVREHDPAKPVRNTTQPQAAVNPQTTTFCSKLSISDPFATIMESTGQSILATPSPLRTTGKRDVTIDTEEDSAIYDSFTVPFDTSIEEGSEEDTANSSSNPAEISLDDEEEEAEQVLRTSLRDRSVDRPLLIDFPTPGGRLEPNLEETLRHKISLDAEIVSSTPLKDSLVRDATMQTPVLTMGKFKRRNLEIYSSQEEDSPADEAKTDGLSSTGESSSTESGSSGSKKLKRRNQSMYASNDDTE
ncbi:lariat debranching enzyme A-like [Patiria miniata]|uniref:Lariat debranching enzyme C-terminal domain-containing protein n=1 Tax=Patiria miniata TaxID=46514 RepID=A0A913ZAN6_PATMI|nr:lariat debranching enzyme A-like [Patiria miniata]XP_038048823.1 lariat debranching enzyme A-like [Patiria miniata]XP_038048824.1 lariat debranching enzyme A-like [Patiria miniata]XP_038048825.1 lariat debranching enzyme A-like [Patiria miniata]